jgi:hypothetical protein
VAVHFIILSFSGKKRVDYSQFGVPDEDDGKEQGLLNFRMMKILNSS